MFFRRFADGGSDDVWSAVICLSFLNFSSSNQWPLIAYFFNASCVLSIYVLTPDKHNDSWLFWRAKFKGAIGSNISLSKSIVAKNSSSARVANRPIASGSYLSFSATDKATSNCW